MKARFFHEAKDLSDRRPLTSTCGTRREIRLPMVQEPAHRRLEVQWNILMDYAVAEPLLGHPRRRHGSRRHHDIDAEAENALDKRNDSDRLADAGRMNPDQRTHRPVTTRDSVALAAATPLFLTLVCAPCDIAADQWIGRRPGKSIGVEHGARPTFAHWMPSTRR